MRTKAFLATVALSVICVSATADVRLPAVIGDGMVLQQQTQAPIWGWAEPGEKITVTGSWDSKAVETTAGADGKWMTKLATTSKDPARGPYTLSVKGKNEIVVSNILLGEVWICSGQSNMQFPMGKGRYTGDLNNEKEIPAAKYPNIRLFTVVPKYNVAPQDDCNSTWKVCTPETVKTFSAVGYYFGRAIHTRTGTPVGLICAAYGGTAAEAWTKRDAFAADSGLAEMLAAYDKDLTAYPQLRTQYDKEQKEWDAAKAKAAAEGKEFTQPQPKKPGRVPNQNSPSVLWNAMVNPIEPFAMRGVIWYQGETNVRRPQQYVTLFQTMIASWRKEWNQGEFPFYFVQIAPYKDMTPDIREAQLVVSRKAPNVGMVVTTDVGNCSDIHPRDKQTVGERLARWALAKTYHLNLKAVVYDQVRHEMGVNPEKVKPCLDYISGPICKEMKVEDGKVRVSFDYAESGLKAKGDELGGFTIAGADRKFLPAKAKIDGQTVIVWSDEVKAPSAVRFGWTNCPEAILFNEAGLPASPFRTDEWPWGETAASK